MLLHADTPLRFEIFSYFDEDIQVEIAGALDYLQVAELMADMSPDDRADLFNNLSEVLRKSVLPVRKSPSVKTFGVCRLTGKAPLAQ